MLSTSPRKYVRMSVCHLRNLAIYGNVQLQDNWQGPSLHDVMHSKNMVLMGGKELSFKGSVCLL